MSDQVQVAEMSRRRHSHAQGYPRADHRHRGKPAA
jgi:hypothetical protein